MNWFLSHRRHGLILVAALTLLVAGCGSSDDGPTNPTPPGPEVEPELMWDETTAAVADAGAVIDQGLGTVPLTTLFSNAASALAGHSCVASVAVDITAQGDPRLVAEFSNGIVLVMPVVRVDSLLVDRELPPQLLEPAAKSNALPDGTNILLMDQPYEFTTDVSRWEPLLENVGYDVHYRPGFLVEHFQNLDSYDVVYICTHGELFEHEGQGVFGMVTSQLRSTQCELEMLRDGDFQDLSVVLSNRVYIVANENPYHPDRTFYSVTNRYLEKYTLSFPDNSLFYADACESMMPSSIPLVGIPLAESLGRMNMGTVIGWDEPVYNNHAAPVSNLMIGWLLGNMDSSLRWITHPTPPFRPWSLLDSFAALQRLGLHQDSDLAEMIVLQLNGTSEPLIRPSISQLLLQVEPEEGTEELKLLGDFGDRQGTVSVYEEATETGEGQGTSLTVTDWSPTAVTVEIDQETAGYIMVKVGPVTSNVHPLSSWEGDFQVSGTVPTGIGPRFNLTIRNSWRAEIVNERVQPEGLPSNEAAWTGTMLGERSSCEYEFSGTFETDRYIYEYLDGMNQGSQPMAIDGSTMFFGTITLKPSESLATFQILMSRDAQVMKTDKQNPEAGPVLDQVPVNILVYFTASMDQEGVIAEGNESVPFELSWPEMEPRYPVLEDTGR